MPPSDTGDGRPSRVPQNHRAVAEACPTARPAGACSYPDAGLPMGCGADSQCTAGNNGRCVQVPRSPGCSCSYDQCTNDSECGMGMGPCACRASTLSARGANVCVAGNCRVDADCGAGGYCSPSLDFSCGAYFGVTGYYCHTPADECLDDADCAGAGADGGFGGPPFCGYSRTVGHWACSRAQCAG